MVEIAATRPISANVKPFAVPDFKGMTYEQADQAIQSIEDAFGKVVNNLMAKWRIGRQHRWGEAAAHVVGLLRAASAVPHLMKISITVPPGLDLTVLRNRGGVDTRVRLPWNR